MKKRNSFVAFKACFLLLPCFIFFSACGKKGESQTYGIDGFIYVAQPFAPAQTVENLSKEHNTVGWHNIRYSNGYLYYNYGGIGRIPLNGEGQAGEGEPVEVTSASVMGKNLLDYAVDGEGSLYLLMVDNFLSSDSLGQPVTETQQEKEERYRNGSLFKMLSDGTLAYQASLSGIPLLEQLYDRRFLAAGNGQELYLLAEDGIYLFDAGGKQEGRIETKAVLTDSTVSQDILEGEDGKVYYCVDNPTSYNEYALDLYEVVKGKGGGSLSEVVSGFTGTGRAAVWGSPYGVLLAGEGVISQYRGESHAVRDVLRLQDSDLLSALTEIVQVSEERFLVCTEDYYSDTAAEWYLLTRTPVEGVPPKENLVVATHGNQELENVAARYNRANSRYHVTVETFAGEGWQERLDARIVSSDPPDLLDLDNGTDRLDIWKYAGKQALEDLYPYLEESSVLDPEMIWECILDSYTLDGRLVCIPSRFSVQVLVGRRDLLGTREGWTLGEMRKILEENPRLMPIGWMPGVNNFFDDMLEYMCADSLLERFVDWEGRECRFGDGEFPDFMRWLADYCRGKEMVPGMQTSESDEILSSAERLDGVWDLLQYTYGTDGQPDESVALKGFPTDSGEPVYYGRPMDSLGILSGSGDKEGAWSFLEYYLTRESFGGMSGFSFRKEQLEDILEDAMTPEYWLDGEGNVQIDKKTGEPRKKTKHSTFLPGGKELSYDILPQEAAEQLLAIIGHTRFILRSGNQENILSIIREEMSYYLGGTKSIEEVTDIIQNRASNLVQEGL